MTRSKKEGSRRRRMAVAGAVAAAATMAFGVASASAVTPVTPGSISVTYDDAALNLPVIGTSDVLSPPNQATMNGTITDTSVNPAAFTVLPAGFVFPPFSGTANGLDVSVALAATDNINGTVDKNTGDVTTAASHYLATVTIPALSATCHYTINQAFSTGPGSPFNGHTFTVDSTTVPNTYTLTHGILQTGWASIPPSGETGCGTIDGIVSGGPGGLEFGNGFDLTPDTGGGGGDNGGGGATVPPPAPTKKKCKKAKKGSASAAKKSKCKKKKK